MVGGEVAEGSVGLEGELLDVSPVVEGRSS